MAEFQRSETMSFAGSGKDDCFRYSAGASSECTRELSRSFFEEIVAIDGRRLAMSFLQLQ